MSDLLHERAGALVAARDHAGLHRILRALEMNSDLTYMDAFDRFSKGVDEVGPTATVEAVLEVVGVKSLSGVAADLRTLEAADEARAKINDRIVKAYELDAPSTDVPGRDVPVGRADQPPRIDGGTFSDIMSAQPVHWARLHEARQLSPGNYDGRTGEERFAAQDRDMANAGFDLVGGMRGAARVRAAQQQAAAASRRLDAALQNGSTPTERRKLLDAAATEGLRQLEAPAPSVSAARQGPLVPVGELRQLDAESRTEQARRLQQQINEAGWNT